MRSGDGEDAADVEGAFQVQRLALGLPLFPDVGVLAHPAAGHLGHPFVLVRVVEAQHARVVLLLEEDLLQRLSVAQRKPPRQSTAFPIAKKNGRHHPVEAVRRDNLAAVHRHRSSDRSDGCGAKKNATLHSTSAS